MHLSQIFLVACVVLFAADLFLVQRITTEILSKLPKYQAWKHSVPSRFELHRKLFSSRLKPVLSIVLGFLAVLAAIAAKYFE
jgi:hypothetical protein